MFKATYRESIEMPWEYWWNNNLTGYNPDRLDVEIRRESLKTLSHEKNILAPQKLTYDSVKR
jgi:hypothetical protein